MLATIPFEPIRLEGTRAVELSAHANSQTHDIWGEGMVELSLTIPQETAPEDTAALLSLDGHLPGPLLRWSVLQENEEPVSQWTDVVQWQEPDGGFNGHGWGQLGPGTTRILVWWDTNSETIDPVAEDSRFYVLNANVQLGINIIGKASDAFSIDTQFRDLDEWGQQTVRYVVERTSPLVADALVDAPWVVEQFDANHQRISHAALTDHHLPITLESATGAAINDDALALGTFVSYDSATGHLSVRSADALSIAAMEIVSPNRWFLTTRPPAWQSSPFDVARADKLFRLDTQGFTQLDFGAILPTGLTRDVLQAELKFDGAYRIGGGLAPYVLSVDGDISWEQALREHFRPTQRTGESTLTGTITFAPEIQAALESYPGKEWIWPEGTPGNYYKIHDSNYRLELGYRLPIGTPGNAVPPPFAPAAYWEISFDGGDNWPVSALLDPCASLCVATLPLVSGQEPMRMRIRNTSPTDDITLEHLTTITPIPRNMRSFTLHVAADEVVSLHAYALQEYAPDLWLEDAAGQLVASTRFFALRGPQEGIATYTAYLPTAESTTLVTLQRSPSSMFAQDIASPDVLIDAHRITLRSWQPIDLRTCGLADFSWDGPEFTDILINAGVIELLMEEPIVAGMYTLQIAAGRCLNTLGIPLAGPTMEIDAVPPELVEFSLETRRWLPPGEGEILLRFSEPFYGWQYDPDSSLRLWREDIPLDVSLDSSNRFDSSSFHIPLGNLTPGEYRLEMQDLAIFDRSGNQFSLPHYDFTFVVSERSPDGNDSPFDLDLNGVVDDRDLRHLTSALWLWSYMRVTRFDLNADGEVNDGDTDFWLRNAWAHQPGDVDLDGDFDDADLALLAGLTDDTPADWRHGDFNGDGYYTTADLVLAMRFGLSTDIGSALDDRQERLKSDSA